MAQQGKDAVADQVGGGLAAGDHEEARRVEHLASAQALGILLDLDQGAQDVLARRLAALCDDATEIGIERLGGLAADPAFAFSDRRLEQPGAGPTRA